MATFPTKCTYGPLRDGALLGAVGISGDASDQDEACAIAGIAAAGLVADPGDAPG
jgi:hypothetical protein